MENTEKQKPIIIKDNQTGEPIYTLEFNRKIIAMAERVDFRVDELGSKPYTTGQMLFYFSFLMHHPKMKKETTDKLYDELDVVNNTELLLALRKLYGAGLESLNDGEEKNARYALVM